MLWRGQLIYRTDFSQLKWFFNIINQQPFLTCKATKWRNKCSPQLKHGRLLHAPAGVCMPGAQWAGMQEWDPCCSAGMLLAALLLVPAPARPRRWDSLWMAAVEHPWAVCSPQPGLSGAPASPRGGGRGGSLGDRRAGTAASQTQWFLRWSWTKLFARWCWNKWSSDSRPFFAIERGYF